MTTQKRPLGAQISHALKARGVNVIFGIPGVHNIELYRGIEEAGITHILARHEQGAGFLPEADLHVYLRPDAGGRRLRLTAATPHGEQLIRCL